MAGRTMPSPFGSAYVVAVRAEPAVYVNKLASIEY
jgi:hypothetical protein